MSQILARGFDENSDFDGGLLRCGENSTSCTLPANLLIKNKNRYISAVYI
ncbi:msha pilin protein mshd [Vibrio parahaemolyticus AQ3810]|nr:msha pilin protein mshd [Vibrio parahaemolyticus AQ3810]